MSKVPKSLNEKTNFSNRVPLIGVSTGVMVMCLVLLFGYQSLHPAKVSIERRVETSGTHNRERLPAVVTILDSRTALGLSASQIDKLQLLQDEQVKALEPIERQLNKIMSPLINTNGSGATRSMSPQVIQVLANQISAQSKRKREIENGFSARAWSELSRKQQEKAFRLSLSRWPFMATRGANKR